MRPTTQRMPPSGLYRRIVWWPCSSHSPPSAGRCRGSGVLGGRSGLAHPEPLPGQRPAGPLELPRCPVAPTRLERVLLAVEVGREVRHVAGEVLSEEVTVVLVGHDQCHLAGTLPLGPTNGLVLTLELVPHRVS